MSDTSLRTPLRPLSRILPARARGENTDQIEKDNIRKRHEQDREMGRATAQSRIILVGLIFVCLYLIIAVRVAALSASEASEPRTYTAGSSIVEQRRDIVDRKGRILATNMNTYSLYVEVPHLVDPVGTAKALADVFPDLDQERLIKDFTGKRKFLWIKKKLSPEQKQAAHDIGDPGLRFGPREMRLYPNGKLAAHVMGGASFGKEGVAAAEVIGVAGVEKTFDQALRDPSLSGKPLQLSLDLSVQAAMEQVLYGGMKLMNAKGAAGVLMDVHTGEVISIVSLPDFDPNQRPHPPVEGHPDDSPLFNRSVQGVYELGSTFKIFAVAQAMDLGLIDPETMIDTKGPIKWGRFRINDFHNYGNQLTASKVIEKSSNIGTARIAQMIGTDRQQEFLRKLGLLDPIEFEMIEASGGKPLLPPKWSDLSTMTISYGHGLSTTPLHLAAGYAAIANGGHKVTPTLIKTSTPTLGPRVMSENTARQSVDMLRRVVTEGTASLGNVEGYAVAGKTGTADKPDPRGKYYKDKVIATFATIFPADEPKYALVVTLDEPTDTTGPEPRRTAGWTAVPVAAEVISRVAPLLGLRPRIESQESAAISQSE